MPYNCCDIENLLNAEIETGFDWDEFDKHLLSCEKCRSLIELDPKANDLLSVAIPATAPTGNYAEIMKAIRLQETEAKSIAPLARYLVPILTGAISMALVFFNKLLFDNAIKYLNLDIGKIIEYFSFPDNLKTSIVTEAVKVSESPLLLTACVGLAFLIWFHSISSFEKVSK
jgi:hypothetical protein